MTKADIVSELFLDFNRDPYKNKSLVEHYVKRLADCDIDILNRAINELSNQREILPRCKDILSKCTEYIRKTEEFTNKEDCELCGNSGRVKGVFVGKSMVSSLNFLPEGSYCYSAVVGRCSCEARNNWSPSLPVVEPSKMLYTYSTNKGMDCSLVAQLLSAEINKRKFRCEEKEESNTSQSTQELREGLPF